jgi:hypothetical protein
MAFIVDLPVPPLFESTPVQSEKDVAFPTMEVVFWSETVRRWVHLVSLSFVRALPEGHVQAAAGDLAWIEQVVRRSGVDGLRYCVEELEADMVSEP